MQTPSIQGKVLTYFCQFQVQCSEKTAVQARLRPHGEPPTVPGSDPMIAHTFSPPRSAPPSRWPVPWGGWGGAGRPPAAPLANRGATLLDTSQRWVPYTASADGAKVLLCAVATRAPPARDCAWCRLSLRSRSARQRNGATSGRGHGLFPPADGLSVAMSTVRAFTMGTERPRTSGSRIPRWAVSVDAFSPGVNCGSSSRVRRGNENETGSLLADGFTPPAPGARRMR